MCLGYVDNLIVFRLNKSMNSQKHCLDQRNAIHGRDFEVKSTHLQLRVQMWTHRYFRCWFKNRGWVRSEAHRRNT